MSRLLVGAATVGGTSATAFGTIMAWRGDGSGLLILGLVLLLAAISIPTR
jgi:hypothetical protein